MLEVRAHDIHTQSTKEDERGGSGMTSKRFGIISLVMVMMASMIAACSGARARSRRQEIARRRSHSRILMPLREGH